MGTKAGIVDDPVIPDPLPKQGAELGDEDVVPDQQSLYDRLTGVDQETQNPVGRFFSNVGGAVLGAPGAALHAAAHPIDTISGMADSVGDAAKFWTDPNTYSKDSMKAIGEVAPEALGQATGTVAAGEMGAPLAKPAMRLAGKVAGGVGDATRAVKGSIGTAMRDELGELKPGVRTAAQVAGGGTGAVVGGGAGHVGGLGGSVAAGAYGAAKGAKYGPRLLDKIVPERPGAFSMKERQAVPASNNPNLKINAGKLADQVNAAKQAAAPPVGPKVQPWQGPAEAPETPVTGPKVSPWQGPVNLETGEAASNPIMSPGMAADPFNEAARTGETSGRTMIKTPGEWQSHDLLQKVLGREASEKGMGYAARGKGGIDRVSTPSIQSGAEDAPVTKKYGGEPIEKGGRPQDAIKEYFDQLGGKKVPPVEDDGPPEDTRGALKGYFESLKPSKNKPKKPGGIR